MSGSKRRPATPSGPRGKTTLVLVAVGLALLLAVGLVAFAALRHPGSPTTSMAEGGSGHTMPMPAADTEVPDYAMQAGVAEEYAYAVQNYDVLRYIPCTCGCSEMGHLDNWNCYVRSIDADGGVTWDPHAAGCEVCILITRDVIAMRARGTPLSEIRAYIDANYTGAFTDTILPPAGV